MNYRTTIALLVLLLAAGGFYLYVRDDPAPPPTLTTGEGDPLFAAGGLAAEHVDRLTITRDGTTFVAEREGDDWRQVEPTAAPLQDLQVQGLLEAVVGLRSVTTFTPGVNDRPGLQRLGLDPPLATLTLAEGTKQQTLRLGERASGRMYLRLNDEPGVRGRR